MSYDCDQEDHVTMAVWQREAERAERAEALAAMLAEEIRHALDEGCDDGCLVKALAAYDDAKCLP